METLILSLDKPDPSLDALWLKEAEDRLAAYRSGELGAVDGSRKAWCRRDLADFAMWTISFP